MINHTLALIGFLTLSIIIVTMSVMLPSKVHSLDEMVHIKFGLPVAFLEQDQSEYDYLGDFPHDFTLSLDFQDRTLPITYDRTNHIISVAIVWAVLSTLYLIIRIVRIKSIK